ncbi:MAG: MBL fold metallo-hydrolase [Actinomycetota bacterium]|nr:MBL fold metallo-hydrolase [Actinomycetota bacterium]
MKLTILVDNYVDSQKLKAEHGFSALIEDENQKILFDCGQSDLVLANSKVLGIDLNKISKIVLSHGHYDHTGGLLSIIKYLNREIDVYAHPLIFEEKFSKYKGFNECNESRYIGIPEKLQVYEKKGAKFLLNSMPVQISEDIYLSGQINKDMGDNNATPGITQSNESSLFIKRNNRLVKDPLFDDISIFINLSDLLLIVTGCAHSGIVNILKKANELKLARKELVIIGGLHLLKFEKHDIDKIIGELKKYNIKMIVPSHCTGIDAFVQLKNNFGDKCLFGSAGKVFKF